MTINLDDLRKQYEDLNKNSKGNDSSENNYYKIKEGVQLVRILPWKDDTQQFYSETKLHYVPIEPVHNPKDKVKVKTVNCRRVHGEDCPLCNLYYDLWKEERGYGSELHKMYARKIKPNERYYMNAFIRETKEVKILSMGQNLYRQILGSILDPDFISHDDEGNQITLLDMKKGHDYKIDMYVDMWPKYERSSPRPKSEPLGDNQLIAAIPEMLHDIHAIPRLEEYEDLKVLAENILSFISGSNRASEDTEEDEYLKGLKA